MENNNYNNALNNSVNKDKIKKKWDTNKFRKAFAVMATASMIFSAHELAVNTKEVYDDRVTYTEIVTEHSDEYDSTIVEDRMYDHMKLANMLNDNLDAIENPTMNDLHIEVFKMYNYMSKQKYRNELGNMDIVFGMLRQRSNELSKELPESFHNYVVSLGYVDKTGDKDLKAYSKAVRQLILDQETIKELEGQVLGGE